MRITNIEFENFRNFRDHGEIKCSTDGKVTIIYGKNGDGKTTLHQLFQGCFTDKFILTKQPQTVSTTSNMKANVPLVIHSRLWDVLILSIPELNIR